MASGGAGGGTPSGPAVPLAGTGHGCRIGCAAARPSPGVVEPVARDDAVLDLLRAVVRQVGQRDVGALRDRCSEMPSTDGSAHALEDRDLVVVHAHVVLLVDPDPGQQRTADQQRPATAAITIRSREALPLRGGPGRARVIGSTRSGAVRVSVVAEARAAAESGGGTSSTPSPTEPPTIGRVLPEVDVDDVRDDARDVVGPAAAQRQLDQPVGALPRVRVGPQRVGEGLVADHPGQAVGAQQVPVAGPRLADGQRRLDLLPGQRAQQQRALRVGVRLLLGDPALVDQRLDERVVLGDLGVSTPSRSR